MDSLNLSIPKQHDYNDPTVERDVARLQYWLTNLPLMDVVETVRLAISALDALNEQKLDVEQRFQFLEVYRDTAHRLFVTVDPLHLRQLALSKSQRKDAIDGVERLFAALTGGYKLIVTQVYHAGEPGKPDPLLGPAINRSLEQLGFSLLDSYRFYSEVQPSLIAESHQLYRLARHYGLLDSCIESSTDIDVLASIAAIYQTSMLLSLTDPFRLAEGEVGLLYDVLLQHAQSCRIIPGSQWSGSGEGLFLINLDSEDLPVPCTGLQSPVDVPEPYMLDATAALAAVRERLTKTPAKVRMQSPEAMVLRRLLPETAGADKRREQRTPDGRWINLLRGVENIHGWLVRAAQKGADSAVDARVGDLIGIIEAQHERESIGLGMIRSIRVYRKGGMEVGLQLMKGGLGAVSCHAPDEPETLAIRALFMPASEDEQIAATLVVSKGFYSEKRQLLIDVGGREVRARAGRCVVDSPVFDRFEFSAE